MKQITRLFLLVFGLTCISSARGQSFERDQDFVLSPVEQILAGDAPVIVREYTSHLNVKDIGHATLTQRKVLTILKAEGREEATLVLGTDGMRRMKNISGEIRDAHGKLVRKLRGSEIKDFSGNTDISIYDDYRVRVADLLYDSYPYTAVFEYELEFVGLPGWPTWYPQDDGNPVMRAEYVVEYPASIQVRYRTQGDTLEPVRTELAGRVTLRWTVGPMPSREPEPYGPSVGEQVTAVFMAPDRFDVLGYPGSSATWKDLGGWAYGLTEGRWGLPPHVRKHVDSLIQNLDSDLEKAKVLYEYMQSTTRYVNISLGIGGWQPHDATYVGTRGYGDCKALTNYMKALLMQAGIKSWASLIWLGHDGPEVPADFPSNHFNHVILNVPLGADTVWLECTNQNIPFGHISASNEGKNALVLIPNDSKLVRTPVSKADDNLQIRVTSVNIGDDGNATVEMATTYTGNQQDRIRGELIPVNAEDRIKWIHEDLDIPAFDVLAAGFDDLEKRSPAVRIPIKLRIPRFLVRTGTRLFLTPTLAERAGEPPRALEKRTQPVRIAYAYRDIDTVYYSLPAGYKIEAAPKQVAITTSFGRFESGTTMLPDGRLMFRRLLEMTRTTLPPEEYEAFRTFRRQVMQADKAQVVLVKAATP